MKNPIDDKNIGTYQNHRTVRGGDTQEDSKWSRSSQRAFTRHDLGDTFVGFRVSRTKKNEKPS